MFVTQRVIELTEAILRKSSGYQAELAELQTLADEGDQVALYHLGLLLGGPQLGGRHEGLTDHPRAVACFEACLAIPPAKINLGLMLYYGLGAEKDIQRAKRLFVEVIRRHRNCAGPAMFNNVGRRSRQSQGAGPSPEGFSRDRAG